MDEESETQADDDAAADEPRPETTAAADEPRPETTAVADEPPSEAAIDEAARAVEAIVMVATDPVEEQELAQLLELPIDVVGAICRRLADSYRAENRGFEFAKVAGGWRYQTHPDCHPYVERYVLEGKTARLSGAALETLAIVAYKQPISRAQVSAIRGVNVDGVLRTLVQRGYVEEIGRDLGPGQATLFGTTDEFLDRLGLATIDDLPPLGDFVPSAEVVEALENTLRADDNDLESASTAAEDGSDEDDGSDEMVTVADDTDDEANDPESTDAVDLDAVFSAATAEIGDDVIELPDEVLDLADEEIDLDLDLGEGQAEVDVSAESE